MVCPLCYADSDDPTNANLALVISCAGIFVGSVVVAFVPIAIAWARRIRQKDSITPVAIFWSLAIAAVSIWAYATQMRWRREYMIRITSGYFDPSDAGSMPKLPWALWGILGFFYVLLIGWALIGRTGQE